MRSKDREKGKTQKGKGEAKLLLFAVNTGQEFPRFRPIASVVFVLSREHWDKGKMCTSPPVISLLEISSGTGKTVTDEVPLQDDRLFKESYGPPAAPPPQS